MEEIQSSSYKCSITDGYYKITTYKISQDYDNILKIFYCYNQNTCKLFVGGNCPHQSEKFS